MLIGNGGLSGDCGLKGEETDARPARDFAPCAGWSERSSMLNCQRMKRRADDERIRIGLRSRPADHQGSGLIGLRLCFRCTTMQLRRMTMKWKTPAIIDISLGLEINAYACAEVK
jgi:coenzyme PQQ precursor peptide PqqA